MDTTDFLIIAAGVFAFALVSRRAESGIVTGPMVFTTFGLIVGTSALDLVDLPIENSALNGLAEITLVLALFTDASRIDVSRLDASHNVPLRLLGIGLPLSMILGTIAAYALFPDLGLWGAAIVGVILAPTDAALGQAVVSNARVPQRIRQGLNVESGLNDGLAFPVLLIVLSLAFESEAGRSVAGWGTFIAGQLLLGPLAGLAVGFGGAWLVERCTNRQWMNRVFLQISVLSLAILAYAGAEWIGGNGFIAAFVAGVMVGTRSRHLLEAIEDFGETEGQLLSLVVFLLFGAVLLPEALADFGWRHFVYALLSLTILRMIPVAIALFGARLVPVTVVFLGWFGPRGLASILYLLLILEGDVGETSVLGDISTIVLLTVALSVVLHGASAAPAARAYARRIERLDTGTTPSEHRSVPSFPIRFARPKATEQTPPAEDSPERQSGPECR